MRNASANKSVSPSDFEQKLKQCLGQAVHVQQRAQVQVEFQDATGIHRDPQEAGRPSAENPEVIKEKEKPDLGKEKSMGQFAPGTTCKSTAYELSKSQDILIK